MAWLRDSVLNSLVCGLQSGLRGTEPETQPFTGSEGRQLSWLEGGGIPKKEMDQLVWFAARKQAHRGGLDSEKQVN